MMIEQIEKDSFLVGGAVRDIVLGQEPHDKDFVVVGHTPEEMINAGFKQVGNDFPVFLHPDSGDEFALARTEEKHGTGHTGFKVNADPTVTLTDDLERRDLTMNAIAMDNEGNFIDPFGGIQDIKDGVISHVSSAFKDDPLRVLRVARFAARFNFHVHPMTLWICKEIVASGELETLTIERVQIEFLKALETDNPSEFFWVLRRMGALEILFPEIHALIAQIHDPKWHPEGDAFVHTMEVLDQAVILSNDPVVRFSALVHDLGKGLTPKEELPKHHGHENAGVPVVKTMCERLKLPNKFWKHAKIATKFHMHCHRTFDLNPKTFIKVFEQADGSRNFDVFHTLMQVSIADTRGRGKSSRNSPIDSQIMFFQVMDILRHIKVGDIMTPDEIKNASVGSIQNRLWSARKDAIRNFRKNTVASDA